MTPRSGLSPQTAPSAPAAYRGGHEVKPLPFDPAKLRGLSEKLLVSHHQNNYGGAVRRLNQIEAQIAGLAKDAPPFLMGALKREELVARNSMILHEHYFAGLGGEGKADGPALELIRARFGTYEAWEQDFRLTGMALAGGSGWVILAWDPHEKAAHNFSALDHTTNLAGGVPLLVMDMYEHAYHMDYGANAKGYVDAFFANLEWPEVNRRIAGLPQGR